MCFTVISSNRHPPSLQASHRLCSALAPFSVYIWTKMQSRGCPTCGFRPSSSSGNRLGGFDHWCSCRFSSFPVFRNRGWVSYVWMLGMASQSMEWLKSCCSAGTAASGQAFPDAQRLPSVWKVLSGAWLRTMIKVPRMLLEYRQR